MKIHLFIKLITLSLSYRNQFNIKMKLPKLNPQQKGRLKEIKQEHIDRFLTFAPINKEVSMPLIKFIYSLIKKPMPTVYKVCSPKAAQDMANKLKKTEREFYVFGSYLTVGWASFYAYYETFIEFGIITKEKFEKYYKLREFINSNIFLTIEFENAIIICEKPIILHRLNGRMHCLSGPAIKWRDGYELYFINGRSMPKSVYKKFLEGKITREDFIDQENEDVRAGIYELIESKGEGKMLGLLGAKEVDKAIFKHFAGDEEMVLYKTKEKFKGETDLNGKSPASLAWIKMSCPSTGTTYLIATDSSFRTCEESAKYHRPDFVPDSVEYNWCSRS